MNPYLPIDRQNVSEENNEEWEELIQEKDDDVANI